MARPHINESGSSLSDRRTPLIISSVHWRDHVNAAQKMAALSPRLEPWSGWRLILSWLLLAAITAAGWLLVGWGLGIL